ncbi:uncharacterized protein LOC142538521 [Primulina tabacum]|uniref:uncharacterized protein LOC142538521 n=1 Tax=Primulina tabacum TaxID=48773 RepID=UPI003F59215D
MTNFFHTVNDIVMDTSENEVALYYALDELITDCMIFLTVLMLVYNDIVKRDCSSEKWKFFKSCLGALDGTYIGVQVINLDKPKYRNRKGSVADSRVLRDAISRPNGLKVPRGCYYLCDCGYANVESFLAPFRKVCYHLNEWGQRSMAPANYREYFNFKHASTCNIIERAFGLLKKRWVVLRNPSFYGIKTHNQIIMAFILLHNFIRGEMAMDPLEDKFEETMENDEAGSEKTIDNVETSTYWDNWRENLAMTLYNQSLGFP